MKKPCHRKSKVIFHLLLLVVTCYLWFGNVLFFSLPGKSQRKLSLNLGNGACKWTPPEYDIPENIDFYKTLIAGFPSGDKRLTFVQMEALTGWAAKDEWDFEYLGMSNHPFIKANYPHHEGIWGWDGAADQVVMVVRNLRRSLVEYHDILWDIGYAKTWEEASLNFLNLYRERPPLEDFLEWRDLRVMDEIHWYGWFIDYWMEGGLMRDIFSHKLTTPEHWYLLMQPTAYSKDESAYDRIVGEGVVITEKSYDPPCGTEHKISGGCRPVQIISAERLVKAETGPAEGRKIAMTLTNHTGISEYLIEEEAWQCIWTELIINKKGLKTFIDRDGIGERNYNFSPEMLEEMLHELDRLIAKYGSWHSHEPISEQLVDLLLEHRFIIQNELDELLNSPNLRELKDSDFLGPKERAKRKRARLEKEIAERFAGMSMSSSSMEEEKERHLFHVMKSEDEKKQNYAEFYREIEKKLLENRRAKVKSEVFEEEDRRRRKKRKLVKDDSAVTTPDQDE